MLKEKIDDLVDIITEEYSRIENTFLIRNNQQLIKYVENPAKWKAEQIAHRNAYKKELVREAQNRLPILNAKAEKVLLLSYQEVDKDIIKISETEIEVNEKFKDEIEGRIKELRQKNELAVKVLANESFKTYERTVRLISYTSNADNLFEVIKRQMPKGIENGIKVAYKNGRQVAWKSYMEMDTRTTLQTETSARQIEAGAMAGQIFYICDSFADCAKDHADYQGKIYYNEQAKLTKEAEDYIVYFAAIDKAGNVSPVLTSVKVEINDTFPLPTGFTIKKPDGKYKKGEALKYSNKKILEQLEKCSDFENNFLDSTFESVFIEEDDFFKDDVPEPEVILGDHLKLKPDHFKFIVIDECHRSIYGKWRSVLNYFKDATILGLTATPTPEAYAFFDENVIEKYTYEDSVIDGVNVPFRIYDIETRVTAQGGELESGEELVEVTKKTGEKGTFVPNQTIIYTGKALDKSVVNRSQIREVLSAYRDSIYSDLYPEREENWNYIPLILN